MAAGSDRRMRSRCGGRRRPRRPGAAKWAARPGEAGGATRSAHYNRRVGLTIGIVGLPNVGKSTLFNALTKNPDAALAANYPFATIEPNTGVVPVPDERLPVLAGIFSSERTVPATVTFVDIAGIVRGASEGQGLGNKFLSHIRESDAICQVLRAFTDPDVVHVEGEVSPADDMDTINTELILADLQTLDKAIPRLEKEARNDKSRAPVLAAATQAREVLDSGRTVFAARLDPEPLQELFLLTAKPFLYVINADEEELSDSGFRDRMEQMVAPAEAVFLDAKIESELAELPDDEAMELLESVGQTESGIRALARVGFATLGLQTYLTAGPKEAPGVDDPPRRHRPRGSGSHPYRLPEGLHQSRGGVLRRSRGRGFDGGCPRGGPGADGGQGLRDGRRRRGRIPQWPRRRRQAPVVRWTIG